MPWARVFENWTLVYPPDATIVSLTWNVPLKFAYKVIFVKPLGLVAEQLNITLLFCVARLLFGDTRVTVGGTLVKSSIVNLI